jgi:hypothetical protein
MKQIQTSNLNFQNYELMFEIHSEFGSWNLKIILIATVYILNKGKKSPIIGAFEELKITFKSKYNTPDCTFLSSRKFYELWTFCVF